MLSSLKRFIKEVTFGESEGLTFADDDQRLAVAALLIHVISVDGDMDEAEHKKLTDTLRDHYALTREDTEELIRLATDRDNEAVDLYGFTSVLKRKTDEAERHAIIEMMWRLVYADGHVHEFEDNTVWRVAELLGVSSRDRIALRQKVAQEQDLEDDKQQS
ncbi:tellurite resistance TerB family protein [Pannonibacter tanglangensis]|uniref:TerB family tellurite resistance protein n=1 Tax=Pannonibacter tanglangensis TaxID=2750084 RepID=A0ABW9ZPZ2_9HYPH|nr:TerB family tellurite resistance protein [Pannonibacter sp. XCT-34]NBN65962.1 TerB family tellurite resistance protein [Pannonibacter sp. XCT-34]